jgi:hypothetical protein
MWLVDAEVLEFSHILSQIATQAEPVAPPRASFGDRFAWMEAAPSSRSDKWDPGVGQNAR